MCVCLCAHGGHSWFTMGKKTHLNKDPRVLCAMAYRASSWFSVTPSWKLGDFLFIDPPVRGLNSWDLSLTWKNYSQRESFYWCLLYLHWLFPRVDQWMCLFLCYMLKQINPHQMLRVDLRRQTCLQVGYYLTLRSAETDPFCVNSSFFLLPF